MQEYTNSSIAEQKDRIIIADDADIGRNLLKALLRKHYVVLEAKNGVEVVDILRTDQGDISCILLDVMMPVMGGLKVLEFMKENDLLDRIPVIAITAISDAAGKIACYDAGAVDIIEKPYDEKLLLHRVQHYVAFFNKIKSIREKAGAGSGGDSSYYTAVIDSLPQAVFILDATTRHIKYANEKFLALPGISSSPLGKKTIEIFQPHVAVALDGAISDLVDRRTQRAASISLGTNHFSVIFNAILDDTGKVSDIVGTIVNVTQSVDRINELQSRFQKM